ncbi:MAG: Lrp/AsnC family transcriptional regulator [Thermoprotei archaeon]|uniref:Lrp/AsnC family transcriptional regulator n=1 Tax=Fervidicoccus fontis TaxID=683846 RepID=A0A7J3SL94_9CREN|nr:Lrp/AsnC family transcriptional regulator [Thermoprotei archaeon]
MFCNRWYTMSPLTAFVLINTKIGAEDLVSDAIKKLIKSSKDLVEGRVYSLFGEYDLIVVVSAEKIESIEGFVSTIRKMPEVTRTTTLVSST